MFDLDGRTKAMSRDLFRLTFAVKMLSTSIRDIYFKIDLHSLFPFPLAHGHDLRAE